MKVENKNEEEEEEQEEEEEEEAGAAAKTRQSLSLCTHSSTCLFVCLSIRLPIVVSHPVLT